MAKIAQHFTVTKCFPDNLGCIEFSGIVYKRDAEKYDIEDVIFKTGNSTENITQFFHMFRATTDPEFHHSDIVYLLNEWLRSDEGKYDRSPLEIAA